MRGWAWASGPFRLVFFWHDDAKAGDVLVEEAGKEPCVLWGHVLLGLEEEYGSVVGDDTVPTEDHADDGAALVDLCGLKGDVVAVDGREGLEGLGMRRAPETPPRAACARLLAKTNAEPYSEPNT